MSVLPSMIVSLFVCLSILKGVCKQSRFELLSIEQPYSSEQKLTNSKNKFKIIYMTTLNLQLKNYILTFCLLVSYEFSTAQCANQVTHLTGTAVVNGVSINVSTAGNVDTNTAYCVNTNPYFVGYNSVQGSGDGTYTFDFSPPINSLTLNFSGISSAGIGQEAIVLSINGVHYPVPSVGDPNGCDPLAALNPSGDITGCSNCSVSGWLGTTISGTISSLGVSDVAVWGSGNGAIFSLFICDGITSAAEYENAFTNVIYPNPFNTSLNFNSSKITNAEFVLYDTFSKKLIENKLTNVSSINTDFLSTGIYFYELRQDNAVVKKGKLVKN